MRGITAIVCAILLGSLFQIKATELGWEFCARKKHSLRAIFEAQAESRKNGSGNLRQYAPDRRIDVSHLKLELDPDFATRSIAGVATISFSPIAKPLTEMRLDAVDLDIAEVTATTAIKDWHVALEHLAIEFEKPIPVGVETRVTVTYQVEPKEGLYFRTAAMGYPDGDDHLFTQGEPEKHRHWFPSYDYPNERFTTEVICRVPEAMTVISNGRLIDDSVEEGVRSVHWYQEEEHVNYLLSVVAGHFEKLEGQFRDLELAFLTPPSEFAVAANCAQR